MGSIAAAGVDERCAAELEALVVLPTTDAIEAGHRLRTILSGVSRLGPFNVKECLQLGVLLREAHDTACDLHSDVSIRISLFQSSLYGTGGARGLTCFYPGVKDADVNFYAADLRVYMHVTHGIFFTDGHDLQWDLWCFQPTINVMYTRSFAERSLPVSEFALWYDRISTYPLGKEFFRNVAAGVGCGELFDEWFARCKQIRLTVACGKASPDISCRRCVASVAGAPENHRFSHKDCRKAGGICMQVADSCE